MQSNQHRLNQYRQMSEMQRRFQPRQTSVANPTRRIEIKLRVSETQYRFHAGQTSVANTTSEMGPSRSTSEMQQRFRAGQTDIADPTTAKKDACRPPRRPPRRPSFLEGRDAVAPRRPALRTCVRSPSARVAALPQQSSRSRSHRDRRHRRARVAEHFSFPSTTPDTSDTKPCRPGTHRPWHIAPWRQKN